MRQWDEKDVNINKKDIGARFSHLRQSRLEKFNAEFIKQGISDKKELHEKLRIQEDSDLREMGSARKYIKEMSNGARPLPERVIEFYSQKCGVSRDWIIHGGFIEYVTLVMNPDCNTVNDLDCLRIKVQAELEGISYGQAEQLVRIAVELQIIPEINVFTNLIDIYDQYSNGEGLILLLFNNSGDSDYRKIFKPLVSQMLTHINAKRRMTMGYEEVYLYFLDKVVRKQDREIQCLFGILAASRQLLLDEKAKLEVIEGMSPSERKKFLPYYNRMQEKIRAEYEAILKAMNEALGTNMESEENQSYLRKQFKVMTLIEEYRKNEDYANKFQKEFNIFYTEEEVKVALDVTQVLSGNEQVKQKSEAILDTMLYLFEKLSLKER